MSIKEFLLERLNTMNSNTVNEAKVDSDHIDNHFFEFFRAVVAVDALKTLVSDGANVKELSETVKRFSKCKKFKELESDLNYNVSDYSDHSLSNYFTFLDRVSKASSKKKIVLDCVKYELVKTGKRALEEFAEILDASSPSDLSEFGDVTAIVKKTETDFASAIESASEEAINEGEILSNDDISEKGEMKLYALQILESIGEEDELEKKGFVKNGKLTKKGSKYCAKKQRALDEAKEYKEKAYKTKKTKGWKFDPKAIAAGKDWDVASMSS